MKKTLILALTLPFLVCACSKSEDPSASSSPTTAASKSPNASTTPSASTSAEPSPSASGEASPSANNSAVVGTWKVDVAKTTIPAKSDKDKAEEAAIRIEFKADGTFATTGSSDNGSGTWTLEGDKVKLKSEKGDGPPELTLSADGTNLTFGADKSMMVLEKA